MENLMKIASIMLVALLMTACSKDDDTPEPAGSILTVEQLKGNTYRISYFWDQTDRTDEYDGYFITFNDQFKITVYVQSNNLETFGSYSIYENGSDLVLKTVFDEVQGYNDINDALNEIDEEWVVTKVMDNATTIELREKESSNPPEILHLTKGEIPPQ